MQPDGKDYKVDLVKYRLETAEEDLRAAKVLFDADSLKASNNRAYYSIFHSIQAVHAMDGNAYRRHKDAIGNFNKNYVRDETFPRELGRRVAEAQDVRHASDYDDFYVVSRTVTADQIQTAKDLLDHVKTYCESRQYGLLPKGKEVKKSEKN